MMGKTPQDWRGQGWDLSKIPVYRYNTVVVGSGAAGLNSADQLYRLGQRDVAVVSSLIFSSQASSPHHIIFTKPGFSATISLNSS